MSTLGYEYGAGEIADVETVTKKIRDQIKEARENRKTYESTWHSNMAYAAGKFWLQWDRDQRRLIPAPEYAGKELYTADVITEYRTTALGEMGSDDDRPELLLRRDDQPSEDFQDLLNKAVAWGWDYEWMGDQVLEEVRRLTLDLGTAAVRCRFDPTVGPVVDENVPHFQGKPILDLEQAQELFSNGPNPEVTMRPVQQGRITWDALSPFNLIIPPGIPNERDFPWECVVRPALLSSVRAQYGDIASELREDTDIGSVLGYDVNTDQATDRPNWGGERKSSRVQGHVWLFTFFERPCPDYPQGRTIVFGGNKMIALSYEERLPYQRPDGSFWTGIAYFHWWKVTGRFWGRSLVEGMKDVQRAVNKRRTQINQIIDRGLPAVFVEKNSKAKERKGLAAELIDIGPQERQPTIFPGLSPGEWMYHDVEAMRVDLEHATGIRGPRLGENPTNVTTYAQLALLNENDQVKRATILQQHKLAIASLVEASVHDMRTYWGPERTMALVGEEERAESFAFNATRTPTFFIVKVAKGSAKPRSQAAELKKIEDIFAAAQGSGAMMANPPSWVKWLKDSLDQGQALDLPEGMTDEHEDKAELENALLNAGEMPPVQYYDPAELHIPVHREGQIQAELNKDVALWQAYEEHIQKHVLIAQSTARYMAQMAPEPQPVETPPA